jgi:Zn-dependent protease with chaperone function
MREEVPALIFGPSLPPGGVRGTLSITDTGVHADVGDRSSGAALAEISMREVGFDRPGVEVAWSDRGGVWAAHVLDPASVQRLLNGSALAVTPQAAQWKATHRQVAARRSIGMLLLAAALVVPVLLLGWVIVNAAGLASRITARVPIEQEIAIGRQAFASLRGSLKINDQGPAYDAVQSVVAKLTSGSRYPYEVHVAEDASINAFALPGGVIVVHTGLIAATRRPEELAGVLAHEVQHVELRHSLNSLVKELGLRGLWSLVTGDVGSTLSGRAALEMIALSFSRDAEREADAHGLTALAAAGIDPSGMPAFFEMMRRQSPDAPGAFLSTHPSSEERERELKRQVDALGAVPVTPLPFADWPPKL